MPVGFSFSLSLNFPACISAFILFRWSLLNIFHQSQDHGERYNFVQNLKLYQTLGEVFKYLGDLQMLSSKDVNFVGYTYKSVDMFKCLQANVGKD